MINYTQMVQSVSDMDDNTFDMHLDRRHKSSLARVREYSREAHDDLHKNRSWLSHAHEDET